MKKILILASLVVLGVAMTSCCGTCKKTKPAEVKGSKWTLIELNGKVIDRHKSDVGDRLTLVLGDDGRVTGKGDCNGFFGGYTLDKDKISMGNLGTTRMFCPNQELENHYLQALQDAEKIKIDGDYLLLMNKEGKMIASFKKAKE